jgi:hypothetical protein
MEPTPLLDYALTVIFFANDIENGQCSQLLQNLLASADLELAFTEAKASLIIDINTSLDRIMSTWAGSNMFSTRKLVQAVNELRRGKEIKYLISDKMLRRQQETI